MRQTGFASMHCSLARSLDRMGSWWAPLILRDLSYGRQRFDDLAEDLGISRNVLTIRLKELVEAGVVTRTAYQQRPARYEYDLSPSGRDLVPVLMALTSWGDRWAATTGPQPVLYHRTDCGHIFTPTVCCSSCGQAVRHERVEIMPGPGRLVGRGTMLVRTFLARRAKATGRDASDSPLRPPGR